jgi:hypothetical protein
MLGVLGGSPPRFSITRSWWRRMFEG